MEYVLETHDLYKRYKQTDVVCGVNMHVKRGEIYGFVGRNGAGKTTVMRLVCGLVQKSGGSYRLFGIEDKERKINLSRRRTGAIIETPSVYPRMTARQNLYEQCLFMGVTSYEVIDEVLHFVGLSDTGNKTARNFSLGMRQRLGIAMALVSNPDFIILDEPTNGLDPQGIVEIRELLLRLNRERGITILISSHILSELSKLATCYGFIEKGVLIKEISAEELERSCRKSIHITVSSTSRLPLVLERQLMLYDYKIFSETEAELYCNVKISDLAAALTEGSIDLLKVSERDEDLEGYFINLVGGAK